MTTVCKQSHVLATAAALRSQGALGVLELATSTLAMFSGRPAASRALVDAGAVPLCVRLLSPLFPTVGALVSVSVGFCWVALHGGARCFVLQAFLDGPAAGWRHVLGQVFCCFFGAVGRPWALSNHVSKGRPTSSLKPKTVEMLGARKGRGPQVAAAGTPGVISHVRSNRPTNFTSQRPTHHPSRPNHPTNRVPSMCVNNQYYCNSQRLQSARSPHAQVAVVNVANAVGNLAGDSGARLAFRAAGGVGALVRLLRPDVDPTAQTASAAALSLLAARDAVIQVRTQTSLPCADF